MLKMYQRKQFEIHAVKHEPCPQELGNKRARQICTVVILSALAYLSVVNLDYAPLWGDESVVAVIAGNLLAQGVPVVDDGRFVMSHGIVYPDGGGDIARDMKFRYPQLIFYTTALGIWAFGHNEIGARLMSAIFTLGSMLLLLSIAKKEFPDRPWFVLVALGLACFSQMVVLYARSATYNALAMFLALLLFRLYLSFCDKSRPRTAILIAVVAIAGFHAHFLISACFMLALGIFHLLFRRRMFDKRAWILATIVGVLYMLQSLWYGYLDPDTYAKPFSLGSAEALREHLNYFIPRHLILLNSGGIIYWTVALVFCARLVYMLRAGHRTSFGYGVTETQIDKPEVRIENDVFAAKFTRLGRNTSFQYFVFVILAVIATSLIKPELFGGASGVRFYNAFAPFGAFVSAEVLAWLWSWSRIASVLAASLILFTSLPGWPFALHRLYSSTPHWTLPAQVLSFHRDYPSALAESVEYLEKHAEQDDLVFVKPHYLAPRLAFYLGDMVFVGGSVSKRNALPDKLRNSGRKYIFIENIEAGVTPPDWIVLFGFSRIDNRLQLPSGDIYNLATILNNQYSKTAYYRPEPYMHIPNLPRMPLTDSVLIYRKDS